MHNILISKRKKNGITEKRVKEEKISIVKHAYLNITFCSLYPLSPHIADNSTPFSGNMISHWKSTVINDLSQTYNPHVTIEL